MADAHLTVMIALSDPDRAEDIAHALAEETGATVVMVTDLEQPGRVDAIITDGEMLDGVTPHVSLGDGADGANVGAVLPLTADAGLVAAAVRLVAAGFRVSRAVAGYSGDFHPLDAGKAEPPLQADLSAREMETLALLADGASNKVIARQLGISVHTAKFHVASVLAKLHARNRADAVSIALRYGLLYL